MPGDQGAATRFEFRTPLGPRLLTLFGVVVIGGVGALMAVAAVYLLGHASLFQPASGKKRSP
jgi:hypothetical protein